MRLICFWCFLLAAVVRAQNDGYYAPQTFRQAKWNSSQTSTTQDCRCHGFISGIKVCTICLNKIFTTTFTTNTTSIAITTMTTEGVWEKRPRKRIYILGQSFQRGLFSPARNDVTPQGTSVSDPWRGPAPVNENWREQNSGPIIPKAEPWRLPYALSKEQQAAILHHKQSLTSEGAFRFEYASDNGLAAGEQIEPDGSRVGAYQYKDPSGQLVKLKYRAGKDGFQILEGSHIPKSPEPVPPSTGDNYYQNAYQLQKQQYHLQQQYNQQKPAPQQQNWGQNQGSEGGQRAAGNQYFVNNWRPQGQDDGQYRDNEVDPNKPHNFGEGYAFAFQG